MSQFNKKPLEHGILNFYWPVTGITLYTKTNKCNININTNKTSEVTLDQSQTDNLYIEIFGILNIHMQIFVVFSKNLAGLRKGIGGSCWLGKYFNICMSA